MPVKARFLAQFITLALISTGAGAAIIPPTKIDAIKKCVSQKMSSTFVWRTHTYYLTADAHYASHTYFTFDTCGQTKVDHDGDDTVNGDGYHGPQPQDIVEGAVLQNDNTYKALPDCKRYKFVGPETFFNDGIETHNLGGEISPDGTALSCNIYTAGSSSVGGGGSHIWAICFAHLAPIYSNADIAFFLKSCARQIL